MNALARTLHGSALAAATVGLTTPLAAGGPGIWPSSPSYCSSCEASAGGPSGVERLVSRIRKEPFHHYAHNRNDLQPRPVCPPYCSPFAGYHEPQWRQLGGPMASLPMNGLPMNGLPIEMSPGAMSYPAPTEMYVPPAPTTLPNSVPQAPPSAAPHVEEPPAGPPAAPPAETFLDPLPPESAAGPSLMTPAVQRR